MPNDEGSRESRAVGKFLETLPQAFWDGIIEAGKTNALAAFGLGFFRTVQDGLKAITPEERQQMARALQEARFEDIEAGLLAMGVEVAMQRQVISTILTALARNTALIEGYAPVYGELLATVARLDSLPREVLAVAEDQLGRIETRVDEVAEGMGRIERGVGETDRRLALVEDMLRTAQREALLRERSRAEEKRDAATRTFELEYLKAVKEEYGELELLGIPSLVQRFPIDAAFVTLSLTGDGDAQRAVAAAQMLASHPRLVIEGEAGAGKTTLLQWEAVRHCERAEWIPGKHGDLSDLADMKCRIELPGVSPTEVSLSAAAILERYKDLTRTIPFFIRLRALITKDRDFDAFPDPARWLALSVPYFQMHPPFENWLHSVLSEGRAVLMLDGLDELPPGKRKPFWKGLGSLLGQYKNLRFRVASRYFPRDDDRAGQWAIPDDPDTHRPVQVVRVEPLTDSQIDRLIEKWHTAAVEAEPTDELKMRTARELDGYAEALMEKLREERYRRIRELAETPFLCAAICLINRHWRKQLPERRHELYRLLIEALLNLREKMREIVTLDELYDSLSRESLIDVHARLALDMMTSGRVSEEHDAETPAGTRYLIEAKREDVLKWLHEYIRIIPELHGRADAERLLDDFLVPRCGLLREPSQGRLDFRHRALQEYLAGTAAMQRGKIDLLVNHAHDDRWRDTIVLAAGGYNVGAQDAKRLIESLIEPGETEHDLKVCYAIAVACLETARGLEMPTVDKALAKLGELVPPRNAQEAKDLSAAGEAVVEKLPYETACADGDIETAQACAETLARVGSEAARAQLQHGYVDDPRDSVVLRALACPGIHPFEAESITREFAAGGVVRLPRFAVAFLRHLRPLEQWPGVETVDLPDCRNLKDLSGLEHLRGLRRLNLTRCVNVTDLAPLARLPRLACLDLRGCASLDGLEPLGTLPKLDRVDLSYCPSHLDVSPLRKLPGLGVLEWLDRPEVEVLAPTEPPAEREGGDVFYARFDGGRMKMVWVPGGKFQMGSPESEKGRYDDEGPPHVVRLDGFWMSADVVTQAQYEAVMGTNASEFQGPEYANAAQRPVETASWDDAVLFCERLTKLMKGTCRFTLPSEAQWEYACRAGNPGRYCFGEDEAQLEDYAWYVENSEDRTHPVGQKKANAFGLYDMHGNVWEWCVDHWHANYDGAPSDGSAWLSDDERSCRVLRGGSWRGGPQYCRSAIRGNGSPGSRRGNLGFRVLAVQAAGE